MPAENSSFDSPSSAHQQGVGRRPKRTPKLRHHKASNQAFVEIEGRRRYLGVYGRPATEQAYHRLIAEWLANGQRLPIAPEQITVVEVIHRYWEWAKVHYARPDGSVSREVDNYRSALRPVRRLYGDVPAVDFGPVALKTVRAQLAESGNARSYVNHQVTRIKRVFRWAVSEELIPPSVDQALSTVAGMRYGQGGMRETTRVQPVEQEQINAVKPFVSRQVWTLIQLQLLTAARPGELLPLRPIDLDMSGDIWVHTPESHKTAHHGHSRRILFGERAQEILRPWLADRAIDKPLFSPAEAEAERREQLHAERATPISCGNRPGSNRVKKPKRQAGDQYTTSSYGRAIAVACRKAHPAPKSLDKKQRSQWDREHRWTPHRLRHTAATRIRQEFGLEAAQVILDHQNARITEVYADRDSNKAIAVTKIRG
ncbi:MAG: tyrosine-type recombinase/integrase [Planctomycetota bacterium]